jgi:molecular chaperone GrpE
VNEKNLNNEREKEQENGEVKKEDLKQETAASPDRNKECLEIIDELQGKLKKAEEEAAVYKDTILRKQADFDNYRKRMIREKEETVKFANTNLLIDLMDIIDDFERAISSAQESKNFDKFHEGIALIEKRFVSMLANKWNLVRFDSLNAEFNPEVHEAVMVEKKSDLTEPVVAEVFQNGYLLNSRVIRNAKVKVFMPEEIQSSDELSEKATYEKQG